MKKHENEVWSDEEVDELQNEFLNNAILCKDEYGVFASISFATYLARVVQVNSDNYPLFLKLMKSGNHWVTNALLDKNNPETFFSLIQPNNFILKECFTMLNLWKSGSIYPQTLLMLLSILKTSYENPHDGYRLYPLTITDLNNLGKHLDKSQGQRYPLNKTILHILDRIASLIDLGHVQLNREEMDVAHHASKIRGNFLDEEKSLKDAIPDLLLERGNYKKEEVAPAAVNIKREAAVN